MEAPGGARRPFRRRNGSQLVRFRPGAAIRLAAALGAIAWLAGPGTDAVPAAPPSAEEALAPGPPVPVFTPPPGESISVNASALCLVREVGPLQLDGAAPDRLRLNRAGPWRSGADCPLSFGYLFPGEVWLRFRIANPREEVLRLVLIHEVARTDRVEFYEYAAESPAQAPPLRSVSLGDRSGETRENPWYRSAAWRLELGPGESREYAVRLATRGALLAPLKIEGESDFTIRLVVESVFLGAFYGSLIALLVYNLSLYLVVRYRPLIFYGLYLALAWITLLIRDGLFTQLIWPGAVLWVNEGHVLLVGLLFAAALQFSREYLETRERQPRADRALVGMMIATMLSGAYAFFDVTTAVQVQIFLQVAGPAVLIWCGVQAVRLGTPLAWYFLLAWSLPLLASAAIGLSDIGATPASPFVNNYIISLGVAGEFLLFSIALAQRLRMLARDKTMAEIQLERLERDMDLARRIHSRALPTSIKRIPGVNVRVRYQPLFAVGGDLYDVDQDGEERVGVLVADVVGHGVSAALDSSTVRIAYRSARPLAQDPADLLQRMCDFLEPYLEGRFVSVVYASLDLRTRRLSVSAAGHPAPLHFAAATGEIQRLHAEGPLIGLGVNAGYVNIETQLAPGDRVLLFTDGIFESHSDDVFVNGEAALRAYARELAEEEGKREQLAEAGLDAENLAAFAEQSARLSASGKKGARPQPSFEDRLLEVMHDVRGGQQSDDITLVVLELPFEAGDALDAAGRAEAAETTLRKN